MGDTLTQTTTAINLPARPRPAANWTRSAISRVMTLVVGISAIVWAVHVFPLFRAEALLGDLAWSAITGEDFGDAQLGTIRGAVEEATTAGLDSSNNASIAMIRLFLVDRGLKAGKGSQADLTQLETAVGAALAEAPANSFIWLIADWLRHRKGGADDVAMLRMSYQTGPNEGWVAVKRNPVAVSRLSSLPGGLVDMTLAEFAKMVGAGLFQEGAGVLADADPAVRERLLATLVDIDEDNRRQFARVLVSKDIQANVPGVEQRAPHRF
jgi:hypothetical protein